MVTLAFDVYGTLINTQGIQLTLADMLHDEQQAAAISRRWREKQLEYSFRRGLMEQYQPFSVCTRQALSFALSEASVALSDDQCDQLLMAYRHLPAFPDAVSLLQQLSLMGVDAFGFTNGEAAIASELLENAGLIEDLKGIVSVDLLRTFKPAPRVYQHFLETADSRADNTWLISGNPFDILGARHAGWRTAWVNRADAPFDPWGEAPDVTVPSLTDLAGKLGL
ncbi:MAG: haloacid dehalogenase type II [Saccharospirillum sp.]|uniref:haloacid dehalogenase type II n=1 Tax=Saccharospirillum sp. TaxID=2033801 RepID=UPI0032990182